jgi:hypothetical protein
MKTKIVTLSNGKTIKIKQKSIPGTFYLAGIKEPITIFHYLKISMSPEDYETIEDIPPAGDDLKIISDAIIEVNDIGKKVEAVNPG